jgi:hypothetical protein
LAETRDEHYRRVVYNEAALYANGAPAPDRMAAGSWLADCADSCSSNQFGLRNRFGTDHANTEAPAINARSQDRRRWLAAAEIG